MEKSIVDVYFFFLGVRGSVDNEINTPKQFLDKDPGIWFRGGHVICKEET